LTARRSSIPATRHRLLSPEFFLALYFFQFSILRPLLNKYNSISEAILFTSSFIIFFSMILFSKSLKLLDIRSYLSFLTIFFTIFIFDILVRPNLATWNYLKYFLIFGAAPIFIFFSCRDYNKIFMYLFYLSSLLSVLVCLYPVFNFGFIADYMDYGYNFALPCFLITYSGAQLYKKKLYYILSAIIFILMFIFANRGAILLAMIYTIVSLLYFAKKKFDLKILVLILFLTLFLINIIKISDFILNTKQVDSYAMWQVRNLAINSNVSLFMSGRDLIWDLSKELFLKKPIMGWGTGYLYSSYGFYEHNIFAEIAVSYGIIGIIAVTLMVLALIRALFKIPVAEKRLILIFLFLGFGVLLFSETFFKNLSFWLTCGYIIKKGKNNTAN